MEINITPQQYKCLIQAIDTASSVFGILADHMPDEYLDQSHEVEELRKFLLSYAADFGVGDMAEEFNGEIIMTDELSEKNQLIMEDYDAEVFWYELEMRLGKRDFFNTMTEEEKEKVEADGWLPERIHVIYQKWGEEFERYGIKRLGITPNSASKTESRTFWGEE